MATDFLSINLHISSGCELPGNHVTIVKCCQKHKFAIHSKTLKLLDIFFPLETFVFGGFFSLAYINVFFNLSSKLAGDVSPVMRDSLGTTVA